VLGWIRYTVVQNSHHYLFLGTYGIIASGDSLQLNFVTGSNVGSRVYLMNEANTEYQSLKLLNQEFTFDVDLSNLGCGINGALYFSQMPLDGGASEYPNNKAGAAYGTGYCDSQCPQDIKFINGAVSSLRITKDEILLTKWISGQYQWLERHGRKLWCGRIRNLLHGDGYLGGQQIRHRLYCSPLYRH
jgi:hypothetical protein